MRSSTKIRRSMKTSPFQALNTTVQTPGWSGFIVEYGHQPGIIDAAAIASGEPLVVPAVRLFSAEIKEWLNSKGGRPSNLTDVFVEYLCRTRHCGRRWKQLGTLSG